MPTPTRTIGPLHLEDLEPHRFEDLIRQLLYDFRPWRMLEATGRAGSDGGFDARATEIVSVREDADDDLSEENEHGIDSRTSDRIWLIQCKREKSIPPKKLGTYLGSIQESDPIELHGIIFAAACDFSKTARDLFREKTRKLGFAEGYLWGKAEIEDILFQPKNDHLLFAYFGLSLQIRKRSLKTQVRSRLAAKRKALRVLNTHQPVLIRDASDERYPYLDTDKSKPRVARGRWRVMGYRGAFSDGLHFIVHRHFAYLGEDGEEWDYAEAMDDGPVHYHFDTWSQDKSDEASAARSTAMSEWDALHESTRAWYEILAVLPYDNILDIDEKGDEHCQSPHIFTSAFGERNGPFCYFIASVETIARWPRRYGSANPDRRIKKFSVQQ